MIEQILRIERHIEKTRDSGKVLDNSVMFNTLKTYLTQQLSMAILGKDLNARKAAIRVSKKFTDADIDHQSRVLNRMSSMA